MPIDYSHEHLSSSIMQVDAPHTPIDPNGGGGAISVTGAQGGSVAAATGLHFPGTVADLGGGVAGVGLITSLLTAAFAFDTLGLDGTGGTPTALADDGFVQLIDLPDGAILQAAWFEITTPFNGAAPKLNLAVQPDDDPDNNSDVATNFSAEYQDTTAPGAWSSSQLFKTGTANMAFTHAVRAITGAALMVYGTFGSPPTAGEATLYAIVATPAS